METKSVKMQNNLRGAVLKKDPWPEKRNKNFPKVRNFMPGKRKANTKILAKNLCLKPQKG